VHTLQGYNPGGASHGDRREARSLSPFTFTNIVAPLKLRRHDGACSPVKLAVLPQAAQLDD
jgi:hypothetical protein